MVSRPFELFDVSGELLLQKVDPIANVPPEFLGKRAELLAHFFGNEQRIGHKVSVTRFDLVKARARRLLRRSAGHCFGRDAD